MPEPPPPFYVPPVPVKSPQRFPWTAVGVFLAVGVWVYFAWLWLVAGKPVGAGVLLAPVLVVLTAPLFIRASRITPGFDFGGLLLVGLVLRFAFSYYRFTHAADAHVYHRQGIRLADAYTHFDFSAPAGSQVPGTGGLNVVSGAVHVLVANDYFGAFLIMAWLSFFGCWFFYRAFAISFDDGDTYRYARLVMLWPSLAFWPSSLGKDAWLVFTLGVASFGVARVLRRSAGGYTLLIGGLLLASFVRPHAALLAAIAFGLALVLGRRSAVRDTITPGFLAKLVGIGMIIVLGSVLVSRTQTLLNIDDLSSSSIEAAATATTERTTEGSSTFAPANPRSITGFPVAAVTVLFRPFPTEATGMEQLVSAVEGAFLIGLTIASWRRLATVGRRLRKQPYLIYAGVYVLLWVLAFGVIANFGILTRQRTQMLPLYFVLLSIKAAAPTVRSLWPTSDPRRLSR